jgi:hypothetical protein
MEQRGGRSLRLDVPQRLNNQRKPSLLFGTISAQPKVFRDGPLGLAIQGPLNESH